MGLKLPFVAHFGAAIFVILLNACISRAGFFDFLIGDAAATSISAFPRGDNAAWEDVMAVRLRQQNRQGWKDVLPSMLQLFWPGVRTNKCRNASCNFSTGKTDVTSSNVGRELSGGYREKPDAEDSTQEGISYVGRREDPADEPNNELTEDAERISAPEPPADEFELDLDEIDRQRRYEQFRLRKLRTEEKRSRHRLYKMRLRYQQLDSLGDLTTLEETEKERLGDIIESGMLAMAHKHKLHRRHRVERLRRLKKMRANRLAERQRRDGNGVLNVERDGGGRERREIGGRSDDDGDLEVVNRRDSDERASEAVHNVHSHAHRKEGTDLRHHPEGLEEQHELVRQWHGGHNDAARSAGGANLNVVDSKSAHKHHRTAHREEDKGVKDPSESHEEQHELVRMWHGEHNGGAKSDGGSHQNVIHHKSFRQEESVTAHKQHRLAHREEGKGASAHPEGLEKQHELVRLWHGVHQDRARTDGGRDRDVVHRKSFKEAYASANRRDAYTGREEGDGVSDPLENHDDQHELVRMWHGASSDRDGHDDQHELVRKWHGASSDRDDHEDQHGFVRKSHESSSDHIYVQSHTPGLEDASASFSIPAVAHFVHNRTKPSLVPHHALASPAFMPVLELTGRSGLESAREVMLPTWCRCKRDPPSEETCYVYTVQGLNFCIGRACPAEWSCTDEPSERRRCQLSQEVSTVVPVSSNECETEMSIRYVYVPEEEVDAMATDAVVRGGKGV